VKKPPTKATLLIISATLILIGIFLVIALRWLPSQPSSHFSNGNSAPGTVSDLPETGFESGSTLPSESPASSGTDTPAASGISPNQTSTAEQKDSTPYSWGMQKRPGNQPPLVDARLQNALAGKGFWIGDTSQKKIYLTFDCGWENGLTGQILDTLKEHQVPAAFFLTGSYISRNPELVKRMAAEGHCLGNHSQTHRSFPALSNREIQEELKAVNEAIYQLTGQQPRFFRPPNGEFDRRTLEIAEEMGLKTLFWSLAYRDWEVDRQPGKEAAFHQVVDYVHNGAVILLHAVSQSNAEALGEIIETLKAEGYIFALPDELEKI